MQFRGNPQRAHDVRRYRGYGWLTVATALVASGGLVAGTLLVGGSQPAGATGGATITVHAGGDRTGTSTVSSLAGVTFQAVPGATTGGSAADTCTTDATGECTLSVPAGSAYTVSETGVPAGYYRSATLDEGDSSTGHGAPYSFVTKWLASGASVDVPGDALNTSNSDEGIHGQNDGSPWSGLMSASRNDPSLSPLCGLRIALILDSSGSMGGSTSGGSTKIADLKAAATSVINALTGTPTKVAIYSFGESTGSSVPLTPLTDAATEQPLFDKINGLRANGGTNWDQGIYQAVTSTKTYDLAIVLTDGNPTTDNQGAGGGNYTNFHNVDNAIFSANALKALGTRVVTIGIGVNGGEDNIRAISGPAANSDYYLATNQNFGDIFQTLATGNCTNALTVQKQVEDPSGNVLANSADANGWQFSGSISAGSTVGSFPVTASQAGTTGITQATVSIPSGGSPTITVTEALKSGYTLDWSKTTCTVDGKTVTTSKVGEGTANPGVSFTGRSNVAISCTFTNKQPTPKTTLTLVKKDASTGAALAGAAFGLHKDSPTGAVAGTCTTDAAGLCAVSGLDVGTYYWVETAAPTGYQLPTPASFGPFQITNANAGGTIATATVEDHQKLTSLTVKKTDESGNPLAGAKFELRKDSAGGTAAGTCTTGADGTCSVANLAFGTYYWVETAAPAGYQLPSPNAAQVVVNAGNAGTSVAATVVKDSPAPTTLTVTKTDESGNPLAGATFELHEGTDGTGKQLYTCTTDSSGACTVSVSPADGNVVGFGSYSWVETKAPTGYQLPAPDVFATTVTAANAGGTLSTHVKDPQQRTSLAVRKTDPSGKLLAGATFALWQDTNGTPGLQPSGASPDTSVSSCSTAAGSGSCSVPGLTFGTYYWVETAAPTGYQLSGSGVFGPVVVDAANAGTAIAATVVADAQQLSTLTAKKTDPTGNPLGGATFELHTGSAGGALAGSCTTAGATGTCSVSNLPFGSYVWVEIKAPTGYQLPSPASFGPVVVDASNAGTAIAATAVQDAPQLSTLTVKKTDPSGDPLAGATFALWQESNGVPGLQPGAPADTRVASCTTSGAGGSCAITGLPFGTYYWVETAAPTGYQLSGSGVFGPVIVDAADAGTAIAATVAADAEQPTTLTVTKTDDAGKPLAGATFALHRGPDATGTVLYTCTTDASGACAAGSPAGGDVVGFGTYTWEETAAPPNYQLADPTTQTVSVTAANAGTPNVVSFSDAPTPVATVTKSVGALTQNADGSWTVSYDLAVRNASTKFATSYTVNDSLGFMTGFTVTSATVSGPGASATWNGTSDTTVATKQSLAKDSTVHYTVTVTGTVAAGAIAANGTCTGTPGHGLFNSATITSAAGGNTDDACATPVLPIVHKTAGTPARHLVGGIWDGSWDVSYAITVTNPSATTGLYYSLSDAPALASTLDFGSATVSGTDNAGHAIASGTGDGKVLTSWTGKSPNTEIIGKRRLPASATDTYAVTINVGAKPASLPATDDVICAATDTPGRGAFNKATVTSGNDSASATACANLPQLPVPTVTKSIASTTQNADGTWTIVYLLTVDNSTGASGTFYALSDTPRFGGGITVLAASMTGPNDDSVKVAGWDPLHGQTVAAKDQPLAAGKSDVYTVTVTADVTTTATVTDRDCTLGMTETGTGFLNSATVQSGANFSTDTACSSPATPTVTKTFVSAAQHVTGGSWDGTWDVTYTLKVTDPGSTGLLYTLDDAPGFPSGVSVNRESVVGPNGAANAWTGTGHIVHNQALAAGKTDTYTVTVNATVSAGTSANDRTCQAGTAGKGFYNAATVTSGHDSSTAHDCGGIPTPGVPTVAKTVTSSVQNADGTWTITYDLAVTNSSAAYSSAYTLSDTLEFGGGITVLSATASGPGVNAAWTGLSPNTVVAGGGSLPPNSSVHYTVTAKARVSTAATTTDRDCTLDTGETGTGFLNTATLSSSGGGNTGTACAAPGSPTVVKKVISAVEGPQWHWVITYAVIVTNGTQNQVSYSLTDTPAFASGMAISSASVTQQRTGADGANVGAATSVAGWTGGAPHAVLGSDVTLPAGNKDTYTVTVTADIDQHIDTALLACSADGAGHGFFNAATMTSGDDVSRVSACAAGAAHGVGGVSTSKPPTPSPSPSPSHGTKPLASTGSNVVLVGAVGALLIAIGALMVLGTLRRRHH
jgi:uncharacterized surface anchored protein